VLVVCDARKHFRSGLACCKCKDMQYFDQSGIAAGGTTDRSGGTVAACFFLDSAAYDLPVAMLHEQPGTTLFVGCPLLLKTC
jgi:hypothetical protein